MGRTRWRAGQFRVPHGIAIDRDGTVFVADRENSRIQLFTPKGEFISEWTDLARPSQVFIAAVAHAFEITAQKGKYKAINPAQVMMRG